MQGKILILHCDNVHSNIKNYYLIAVAAFLARFTENNSTFEKKTTLSGLIKIPTKRLFFASFLKKENIDL